VLPGRLSELPPSSFAMLATLLDPHPPGQTPIAMSVGDPRGATPPFVMEALNKHASEFGEYPPVNGTAMWRNAAAGWIKRRFGVDADPEKELLPLNGTREGLFLAPFIVTPESRAGARPVILLPNPFYQCYAAAILSCGAEPVFVRADASTGFLPDFASLPKNILERASAAYLCSPSNPEGAVAREDYWRTLFRLADTYDFTVFADECYADIYLGEPPAGALSVRGAPFDKLLTFHSLSKRSGQPGLRSGIVAGDANLMAKFRAFRNYAGPQVPMPILAASAACWSDDAHVTAIRASYGEKFELAHRMLGNRTDFRVPEGGFFLWLDVGNGEEAALKLWREAGVRTLPGAYMGRESEPGKPHTNPGFSYLRVALVNDLSTISTALERMVEVLDRRGA
jgi:N-succinyldiaminopimelate aminotransferase